MEKLRSIVNLWGEQTVIGDTHVNRAPVSSIGFFTIVYHMKAKNHFPIENSGCVS